MVQSSIIISSTTSNNARKRSIDSANNTENTGEEEIKRPRIEQNEAGRNRNKRLFGALLGTLNKFKVETEKTSHVDKNRREINEKLHEKLESERKELAEKLKARREEKERAALLKQQEEERLQKEKNEVSDLKQQEVLANFLKTRTEPFLYYLPEKVTDEMSELIKKQKEDATEARCNFERKIQNITSDALPQDDDKPLTDEDNQ